jgi:hypothetical protein
MLQLALARGVQIDPRLDVGGADWMIQLDTNPNGVSLRIPVAHGAASEGR